MRLFLLLFLAIGCICAAESKEKCESATEEDCDNMTSEYDKYRACMERRSKRSANCYDNEDNDCDNCDCNTCSYNSCDNCSNNNNNCCSQCCQRSSCKTYNCCHQTCRAECKSNSCRTACKRKCQDKPVAITSTEFVNGSSRSASHHNITTVIHLNNMINNTNLINLPINVNNRVLNNITNEGRSEGGSYGIYSHESSKENCCLTIGPRQCIRQNNFPFVRCFHIRKKACGPICAAPVVHYQKHEICDNDVNVQQPCRQQVIYVPQPQPRCAYQSNWPYVACGNQEMQSCEGCYSHYIKREDVTKCSNFCYDDGYGIGPYYRQAPFYRPGFAHSPSCYQIGTCGSSDSYGYGYGNGNGYGPVADGLLDNGFPYAYPPQTYPFVIEEDCENCTLSSAWDGPNPQEPLQSPSYKNLDSSIRWTNVSDKILNIDATVKTPRSERYAEIRIKPSKKSKETVTILSTNKTVTTDLKIEK